MSQPSHPAAWRIHMAWAANKAARQLAQLATLGAQETHSLTDEPRLEAYADLGTQPSTLRS